MPPGWPSARPRQPAPVDLLLVGALTIDRFADGRTAAGGSVLHGARAAAAAGHSVAVITVAGREPKAIAAGKELATLGRVHVMPAERTICFGHHQTQGRRELLLEVPATLLASSALPFRPAAVLYAPIAAEFGARLAGLPHDGAYRAAILQGWLRTLAPGRRVDPLPLSAIDDRLAGVLAGCDALIASTEDLSAVAESPAAQLDALRARFGARALLVITEGRSGAWLDDRGQRQRVVPGIEVPASDTVGAGDAFAAILTVELARGAAPPPAAEVATQAAVRLLQGRSG